MKSLLREQLERLNVATSDAATGVIARDWQVAKRDVILEMKCGEEEMRKSYTALAWISRDLTLADLDLLNHLKDVTVTQRTPLRVAHRRANATRDKVVHWMKATAVQGHAQYLLLELCTSAGCYIKEFIHGDFGRTCPSLYDLLQVDRAHCCALDVTDVALELGRGPKGEEDPAKKQKHEPEVPSDV